MFWKWGKIFWKWGKRKQRSDIFELLTEELSGQENIGLGDSPAAHLGQFEAMRKSTLVSYAGQQRQQIKELSNKLAQLSQQLALQKSLYDQRDTSHDAAKQVARIEQLREREAQYQRDQFQIRMKELSLKVAELEGQLLSARSENTRLKALLHKLSAG